MASNSLYDITLGLSIDQAQLTREIQKQDSALKKLYAEAMSHGVDAGMGFFKRGGLQKEFKKASMEIVKVQTALHALGRKERQQGLREEEKALKQRLKERRKALKDEGKERVNQMREAAKAEQAFRARMEKRHARRKQAGDAFGKGQQGFEQGMGAFIKALKSGDVGGLARSGAKVGGQARDLGSRAMRSAGKTKVGSAISKSLGPLAKTMGKTFGFLAKLGPVLGMIARIGGVFIGIVKTLIDAESLMKGFRRQLMKSGVSAMDLGVHMGGVAESVDMMSSAFANLGAGLQFQYDFGVDSKEAMAVVNAYGQAGVRVEEFMEGIKGAANQQERLRKSVEASLVYSNLLGMSANEVATKMGEMMTDMSLSLDAVRNQFAGLTQIASESTYGTKKFFSQVLQATAGISMYNVRLEETGALLKELQGALGAKDGFQMLQKLLTGLSGKGMKDRMKDTHVSKGGFQARMKDAMEAIIARANDMLRDGGKVFQANLSAAAAELNLKLDTTSGEALTKDLRAMSEKERTLLLGKMKDLAEDGKVSEKQLVQLNKYMSIVAAGKGGGTEGMASLAAAEHLLGPIYALEKNMAILAKANAMGGGPGQSKLIAEQLGIDIDTANKLQEMTRMFEGGLAALRHKGASMKEGEYSSADKARDLKKFNMYLEFNQKTGQYDVKGRDGNDIKDLGDALQANRDAIQAEIDAGKEDEQVKLAREIARATTDMTKILGGIQDGVLANIFRAVSSIFKFLFSGNEEAASEALKDNEKMLQKKEQAQQEAIREAADVVAKLTAAAKDPKLSREQRAKAVDLLEKANDTLQKRREGLANIHKQQTKLQDMAASGDLKKFAEHADTAGVWEGGTYHKQRVRGMVARKLEGDSDAQVMSNDGQTRAVTDAANSRKQQEKHLKKIAETEKPIKDSSKFLEDIKRQGEEEKSRYEQQQGLVSLATQAGLPANISPDVAAAHLRAAQSDNMGPGTEQFFRDNPDFRTNLLGLQKDGQNLITGKMRTRIANINDGIAHLTESGGQMEMRIARINPEDVVSVHKGARDPAGSGRGGGSTVVHNNFWEGKGAFNSLAAYERAKGAFA